MRYHEELIGRTSTADKARKGHWMTTLPHRTGGRLVCHATNMQSLGEELTEELYYLLV